MIGRHERRSARAGGRPRVDVEIGDVVVVIDRLASEEFARTDEAEFAHALEAHLRQGLSNPGRWRARSAGVSNPAPPSVIVRSSTHQATPVAVASGIAAMVEATIRGSKAP